MRILILTACLFAALAVTTTAGDLYVPFNPTPPGACNSFPFGVTTTNAGEWRYQFIIPAKYLGARNILITHISFMPCQGNTFTATTFEMSMSHNTIPAAPSMTFAANMHNPKVVIPAGPITNVRTQNTWSTIKLTAPFNYNGKDNLTIELRYKGGALKGSSTVGSDTSVPRNSTYQCYRVLANGTGAYAATTAKSQFSSGMLVIRLTHQGTTLSGTGSPSIGGTVNLGLLAPGDATLPYQVATSLGTGPIPFGSRNLGLTFDSLMIITVQGLLPSVFKNYSGYLGAGGTAVADIVIPQNTGLIGVRLHSAFVTIKSGEPYNFKSISNTYSFTIMK